MQLLTTSGDAALKAGDRPGSLRRHQAAVELARVSFPGEAATWCTTWPDAGRAFALALDGLGQGLRANCRPEEAVAAHEEAQVWWRSLGRSGRPGPRRELAVALRRLGRARRDVEADRAVAVHEEEVELARAALPPDAGPRDVAAACPALGQALALALGNLGQALTAAERTADAVPVHEEEVWWFRPLADIGPDVRASARGRPRASRELAYALGNLGLALAGQRSQDAPAAMRESRALMWGLHDLEEGTELPGVEVPASVRRDVALVEVRLAEVLIDVGMREEALAHLAVIERTPAVDQLRDIRQGIERCRARLAEGADG